MEKNRLCRVSFSLLILPLIASSFISCTQHQPTATEDGSTWTCVNRAGFGNVKNYSVVAMAEYNGYLYAMTRNEVQGAEIWRYDGTRWEQVLFPGGQTNGMYGNPWLSSMWGAMAVFNGKLYCGFSSGHQGTYYDSTGCEIWRYDGQNWEPVISDKRDTEDAGTITAISGCADQDGDTTAQITDSSKNWQPNQWAGGVLQITSGTGKFRRFRIVGNTADTLIVQQNESAGTPDEYTICEAQHFKNPYPPFEYDRGAIVEGATYEIGTGWDENGFGDFWNKMVTEMIVFNGRLYVSTGLNYENGAQVWYTEDGDTWTVTQPSNSFGNYHADENYTNGQKPVSTSIPSLCVSSVSGETLLYAGGTGSSGDKGRCSRLAVLTDQGWQLIVDRDVDENDTGTNENGFGGGMRCSMYNGDFMPWSLAQFKSYLYVGIQSLAGARILYTPNGSPDDGSWFHTVGGDSDVPNGFDGKKNCGNPAYYQQIAVNLFPYGNYLYAGTVTLFAPTLGATQRTLTGAQLWKSSDGKTWVPITRNGFTDTHITSFDCFAVYKGKLYVGANKASVDSPHGLEPEEGGLVFRQDSVTATPSPAYDTVATYETIMTTNGDPTDVYYPLGTDNNTALPIALLLQGGRVDKFYYKGFAMHVARYGFIVLVPNHLNSFSIPGFSAEGLFAEQQQMYDAIAFMRDENENPASSVFGKVDTNTLVMLGHSYGAACTIEALQNHCEYPLCSGDLFVRPPQLKAVALCGINTKPRGKPGDYAIRPVNNAGMPIAIVNGLLDNNAKAHITRQSYAMIEDPPKMLVFINGANHYAMCDMNNPPGPSEDPHTPTLRQEVSVETAARWCALFLRAFALDDAAAREYVTTTGAYLDPNVEVMIDVGE
ncbi:MAG: hypothetical protein N3B18_08430 [Desulfobacterota bacterium]|nr:hypothetical protein [Thermodesulfobacteriota bacterium]